MHKIILTGVDFEIKKGATIDSITVLISNFLELENLATALMDEKNFNTVQFVANEDVSMEYSNMKLITPIFKSINIVDGHIEATFSIREKTDIELYIEALESDYQARIKALESQQESLRESQEIQDGAIVELAEIVAEV